MFILCGTKADKKRKISTDVLKDIMTKYDIRYYFKTSAKENINVKKLFESAVVYYLDEYC